MGQQRVVCWVGRPAIVVEAPPKKNGLLEGPTFDRLAAIAGVAKLTDRFDVFRLFDQPQKQADEEFPMLEARAKAKVLLPDLNGRRVVMLGGRTGYVFGMKTNASLWWHEITTDDMTFAAAVIPPPSGVSRWWADPRNVEEAKALLKNV